MPAIVYSESKIYLGRRLSQTKVWTPKYRHDMALNQSWVWVLTYPFLNIILVVIKVFGEYCFILQHLYYIYIRMCD
jgi:hypothetical protein